MKASIFTFAMVVALIPQLSFAKEYNLADLINESEQAQKTLHEDLRKQIQAVQGSAINEPSIVLEKVEGDRARAKFAAEISEETAPQVETAAQVEVSADIPVSQEERELEQMFMGAGSSSKRNR